MAKKTETLTLKEKCLLRFLYESGCVGEEVIEHIFRPKSGKVSKDKRYDFQRRWQTRFLCNTLGFRKGFLSRIDVPSFYPNRRRYAYLLSAKGYNFVRGYLRHMEKAQTYSIPKQKAIDVIPNFDTVSHYRRLKRDRVKVHEFDHNDYVVRLKLGFMIGFKKRSVNCDLLHKDDALFTQERCDLLVDAGKNTFVGVEYERSEKSPRKYLGYTLEFNGLKTVRKGLIQARQREGFLPAPFGLKAVIVICENENILNTYLRYIQKVMTPTEKSLKYELVDKFFLISKSNYRDINDLFKNGEFIHCRRRQIGRKMDYGRFEISDIFNFTPYHPKKRS